MGILGGSRASSFYLRGGKRLLDLVLILIATPLLLPLTALVALAVILSLGRPVLFAQERPGEGERAFRLFKFRTMTEERDITGTLLPDPARLPRFGRWLRRTSLDEIPELWNVLTGHMSLVGPRPLLARYLERYDARQRRRHEVKPGITGWAQVNGRNAVDWQEKLEMDVWYVDNLTPSLDLKILARTLLVVFTGRGVSGHGEATMSEFTGEERNRP